MKYIILSTFMLISIWGRHFNDSFHYQFKGGNKLRFQRFAEESEIQPELESANNETENNDDNYDDDYSDQNVTTTEENITIKPVLEELEQNFTNYITSIELNMTEKLMKSYGLTIIEPVPKRLNIKALKKFLKTKSFCDP